MTHTDADEWELALYQGMSLEGIYRTLALRDRLRRDVASSYPPPDHADATASTTPPRKKT